MTEKKNQLVINKRSRAIDIDPTDLDESLVARFSGVGEDESVKRVRAIVPKMPYRVAVEQAMPELRPILMEKLEKALKQFGIPNKERKIKFNEFENPSTAALVCYTLLEELSQKDKTYFLFADVVVNLYNAISRAIKPLEYAERNDLNLLKQHLKELVFKADYYRNDFGFYITSDGKFGGYIFDDSLGSAKTKVTMMVKARNEFDVFTLSQPGEMEFEFNILSKEQFEEMPHYKAEFLDALNTHQLPELIKVAEEYGYIQTKKVEPEFPQGPQDTGRIQKSSIFTK